MIQHQAAIEKAYAELVKLQLLASKVKDDMEKVFDYSPFTYLPGKMEREINDIRKHLIDNAVTELNRKYMPNAKAECDFVKLMDEEAGEWAFKMDVIGSWFLAKTRNKEALAKMSYQQILHLARNFVPYHSNDQPWGLPQNPRELVEKNQLVLRAYTWRGSSAYVPASLSYSLNDRGQYNALEKLIDIVTLGKDPATVKDCWLAKHVEGNRSNPDEFYGRHEIIHKSVEAFQFWKNDKFRIWFRRPEDAEKVAFALCGKKHPQTEVS